VADKVVFLSNFGPYRTGLVVFNNNLVEKLDGIEFIKLETSLLNTLLAPFKLIGLRFKTSKAYITITDNPKGFVKDAILLISLKVLGYEIVAHSHSGYVAKYLFGWRTKFYDFFLDKLIVLSDRFLPKSMNHCELHVIGNIPTDPFYEPSNIERKNQIIYVGAFLESKGILKGLEGFAQFSKNNPSYEMLFLGKFFEKKIETKAQSIIKKYAIADKVSFGYAQSSEEVRAYLRESKFMLFPTFYKTEGFPLVVVEAACSGCYIISTNWRAIPDILKGVPSTILEREDIEQQIAQTLSKLDKNNLDHNLIRNAAIQKFSKEEFYNKIKKTIIN
jgi:glycosyltransferase involved in cell wall biosynthesis